MGDTLNPTTRAVGEEDYTTEDLDTLESKVTTQAIGEEDGDTLSSPVTQVVGEDASDGGLAAVTRAIGEEAAPVISGASSTYSAPTDADVAADLKAYSPDAPEEVASTSAMGEEGDAWSTYKTPEPQYDLSDSAAYGSRGTIVYDPNATYAGNEYTDGYFDSLVNQTNEPVPEEMRTGDNFAAVVQSLADRFNYDMSGTEPAGDNVNFSARLMRAIEDFGVSPSQAADILGISQDDLVQQLADNGWDVSRISGNTDMLDYTTGTEALNQQSLVAGTPQNVNEINAMDYAGSMALNPVLQPETQLGTQFVQQSVQPGETMVGTQVDADGVGAGTATVDTAAQVGARSGSAATIDNAAGATSGTATAGTMQATTTADRVAGMTTEAAQGTVSDQAQVQAAQGEVSSESLATGAEMDPARIRTIAENPELNVTPEQLATPAGMNAVAVTADAAESMGISPAAAQQGVVHPDELATPAQIDESNVAQAEVLSTGGLADDATVVAQRLESFTVDNETLAQAMQGEVNAQATVQGQLGELMKQFDDGTPAWAAGALRAANAAMASRGLSGSSMAGAAIVQAAMESAMPIAQQDAQTFAQMNLTNLNNAQQVALSNAAAQQGLELANLSNEQQAAIQNSANAFALQSQELSANQQVVIANAQIKAGIQGQNLSNEQQANMAVAARYAEMNNINLTNAQQTALQNNSNNLQVDLANLSNKQQSYITNAQLEASLQGQVISNEQQTAIANAARFAEAANIEFNAEQQAAIHNSNLLQSVGLAELNAEQAAALQNAATYASMDTANLDNRQQALVQNAKAFLDMDMTNLSNEQQATMFDAQSSIQALFSDQAAENAAKSLNLTTQTEIDTFNKNLAATVSKFNAEQQNLIAQANMTAENQTMQFYAELGLKAETINVQEANDMAIFNADLATEVSKFNATLENQREQFNVSNAMYIEESNVQWRRDINTANTSAANAALQFDISNMLALQKASMDQMWDHFDSVLSYAFEAEESSMDRASNLLIASMNAEMQKAIAEQAADAELWGGIGAGLGTLLGSQSGSSLVKEILGMGQGNG